MCMLEFFLVVVNIPSVSLWSGALQDSHLIYFLQLQILNKQYNQLINAGVLLWRKQLAHLTY